MPKTFYVDVETTGTDPSKHGIISLSYIIDDENDKTLDKGTILMNPLSYKTNISPKALEVNGFALEELKTFPIASTATRLLYDTIRPFMEQEKFNVIGYNAQFDTRFLQELFNTQLPNTYYKTFSYKYLCPFELIKILSHVGKFPKTENQQLGTIVKVFNLEHTPHNSESDIKVTRDIWIKLRDSLEYGSEL